MINRAQRWAQPKSLICANSLKYMVPEVGLEPTWPCGRGILSPLIHQNDRYSAAITAFFGMNVPISEYVRAQNGAQCCIISVSRSNVRQHLPRMSIETTHVRASAPADPIIDSLSELILQVPDKHRLARQASSNGVCDAYLSPSCRPFAVIHHKPARFDGRRVAMFSGSGATTSRKQTYGTQRHYWLDVYGSLGQEHRSMQWFLTILGLWSSITHRELADY